MKTHVRVGRDLVARVPALQSVSTAVLHHHEFYDGSGYPDGLYHEEIPIAARIVGVVDAYCAMISKRSYKEMYSQEFARGELQCGAGTQFDPQVVAAFLAVLDSGEADNEIEEDDESLLPGFSYLRDLQ
jgi:HD-GYP domain-containing protein (c-di-GMP phosphodiesterase class II)